MKSSTVFGLFALLFLLLAPSFASPAYSTNPDTTTLKSGESASNDDGVSVSNTGGQGSGNVTLTPKKGSKKSVTTVTSKTNSELSVTGLDENDIVNLGSSNTANIEGEGGTVTLKGGSSARIKNVASGTGAKNIKVNLPSGGTIIVAPGSTILIVT